MMSLRVSLGLALVLFAGACDDAAPAGGPGVTSRVARLEIPLVSNRKLDLLFVIDNSPGIAPHRTRLLEGYRRFMAVLETIQGGLPDVHIGVVTTDIGTRGPDDLGPGPAIGTGPGSCTSDGDRGELRRATAVSGNFLSDIERTDGTRERNYTGTLADAFVQLADAGAAGCTYARPLGAMWRALTDNAANQGFLRDDAFLAVVFVTSDDDCSFASAAFTGGNLDRSKCATNAGELVAPGDFAGWLQTLKPDPSQIVVLGAFAPPGAPACADTRPGIRLDAFLGGFPNRSDAVSLCAPDLGEALELITQLPKTSLGSPCFESPVFDTDPVAAGLQPDCASWYSYRDGGPVEEVIPACRGDEHGPCWQLRADPLNCVLGGEGVVWRDPHHFGAEANARVIIECVVE
jgi:hypothetical protein